MQRRAGLGERRAVDCEREKERAWSRWTGQEGPYRGSSITTKHTGLTGGGFGAEVLLLGCSAFPLSVAGLHRDHRITGHDEKLLLIGGTKLAGRQQALVGWADGRQRGDGKGKGQEVGRGRKTTADGGTALLHQSKGEDERGEWTEVDKRGDSRRRYDARLRWLGWEDGQGEGTKSGAFDDAGELLEQAKATSGRADHGFRYPRTGEWPYFYGRDCCVEVLLGRKRGSEGRRGEEGGSYLTKKLASVAEKME